MQHGNHIYLHISPSEPQSIGGSSGGAVTGALDGLEVKRLMIVPEGKALVARYETEAGRAIVVILVPLNASLSIRRTLLGMLMEVIAVS
jgi:hypothetical protein